MVTAEPSIASNALPPQDRALFDAAINPAHPADSLDPFAVASLLKCQPVHAALAARDTVQSLRLRARLFALTERAIDHLSRLLDSTTDPAELRRAINSAIKLASMHATHAPLPGADNDDDPGDPLAPLSRRAPSSLHTISTVPEPEDPPERNPDYHADGDTRAAERRADPYHADTPPNTAEQLPAPHYMVTPTDLVRAQVRTLRFTNSHRDVMRLLYWSVALPIRLFELHSHRFFDALSKSAAWTHRSRPYTIDQEIASTEHTATVRVTFRDDADGDRTAIFHLARADHTSPPDGAAVWVTCAIIPESTADSS